MNKILIDNAQFIIQSVIFIAGIALLKFNDLRHLEADMKDVMRKLDIISERVSHIEGYMKAQEGKDANR